MSIRAKIRMTDDEVASFLDEPHKLQLATIGPDGFPHLVTMYYATFDGKLGFWTYSSSQKARNLERDRRVTCLIETGDGYDQLRGVMIKGTATQVDGFDAVREIGGVVYGRYVDGLDGLEGFLDDQARKRNAYLVEPTSVASWDHRKIAAAYATQDNA